MKPGSNCPRPDRLLRGFRFCLLGTLLLAIPAFTATPPAVAQSRSTGGTGDAYFPGSSFPLPPRGEGGGRQESPLQPAVPAAEDALSIRPVRDFPVSTPLPGEVFEPGEVVAIVGGEPILVGDMLLEVNQILNQHLPNAPPEVRERERRNVIRMRAPSFVDAKLLYQDGLAGLPEGVDVNSILKQAEKDFDENALPKLMERAKIGTTAMYDAHLRALGSSLRSFRSHWAREQLMTHLVRQKLRIDEDISHATLLEYYRSHMDQFRHPARARWEELMVRFDRMPSADAARVAIAEMGNRVVHGASFAAVARESSHGFSAADGGVFDWTSPGSLVNREIEEAIFSIPVDYLSDVIETKSGLHIVRVTERKEASTDSFRDAQPAMREKILEQRRDEALKEHLAGLRRRIPNEIVFESQPR